MSESQGSRRAPRLSLLNRSLISSTALLAVIFVLLVVTPVTVSAPIRAGELAVLSIAFVAMLILNFIRVRRMFGPLSRFSAQMERVDLRHPEEVRLENPTSTRELAAFTDAFNAMIDRLAEELNRARS